MARQLPTINIGGSDYAKVATRLSAFHEDHIESEIETSVQLIEGKGSVIFEATVKTPHGKWTGHSFGKVTPGNKSFEKLETIAVGRALAMAGYLAGGEIASAEEMAGVVTFAQFANVRNRWMRNHESDIQGMSRPEKLQAFSAWCRNLIGEDADYTEPENWEHEWLGICQQNLFNGGE